MNSDMMRRISQHVELLEADSKRTQGARLRQSKGIAPRKELVQEKIKKIDERLARDKRRLEKQYEKERDMKKIEMK